MQNPYLVDIGKIPVMPQSEVLEKIRFVRRWQSADETATDYARVQRLGLRAKQQIMQGNLRLVATIAHKYECRQAPIEDLINDGVFGLERAVLKYDPKRGCAFSTYAYTWIQDKIRRAYYDRVTPIRVPYWMQLRLSRIKKTSKQLQANGTYSIAALATALNETEDEIRRLIQVSEMQPQSEKGLDLKPSSEIDALDYLALIEQCQAAIQQAPDQHLAKVLRIPVRQARSLKLIQEVGNAVAL